MTDSKTGLSSLWANKPFSNNAAASFTEDLTPQADLSYHDLGKPVSVTLIYGWLAFSSLTWAM
jgi:hypothetical protein